MKFEVIKDSMFSSVNLGNLNPSEVFHFATLTFEDALKEDAFYMVVKGGKDGRVNVVSLADGLQLQYDKIHKVEPQNVTMVFGKKPMS